MAAAASVGDWIAGFQTSPFGQIYMDALLCAEDDLPSKFSYCLKFFREYLRTQGESTITSFEKAKRLFMLEHDELSLCEVFKAYQGSAHADGKDQFHISLLFGFLSFKFGMFEMAKTAFVACDNFIPNSRKNPRNAFRDYCNVGIKVFEWLRDTCSKPDIDNCLDNLNLLWEQIVFIQGCDKTDVWREHEEAKFSQHVEELERNEEKGFLKDYVVSSAANLLSHHFHNLIDTVKVHGMIFDRMNCIYRPVKGVKLKSEFGVQVYPVITRLDDYLIKLEEKSNHVLCYTSSSYHVLGYSFLSYFTFAICCQFAGNFEKAKDYHKRCIDILPLLKEPFNTFFSCLDIESLKSECESKLAQQKRFQEQEEEDKRRPKKPQAKKKPKKKNMKR